MRKRIAHEVRALRKQRAWSQTELAGRLGLSQSRLSELENGDGSFTAEQLLLLLATFNVTPARFTGEEHDAKQLLHDALARLGAHHLLEDATTLPTAQADDVAEVVRDTLLTGEPRLTTALAPVLIAQADELVLGKLYLDLARVGAERRLAWTVENTRDAIAAELHAAPPRAWAQRARRAATLLDAFLGSLRDAPDERPRPLPPDVLDPTIRSKRSLDDVATAASPISRKWRIVSSLVPEDFQQALRGARVARS